MTTKPTSLERKLGITGKLLVAPVFVLILFAVVTAYSIREFQVLDASMNTVARDLAPDTAVATDALVNLYRLRLQVYDYTQSGDPASLERYQSLQEELREDLATAQSSIQNMERAALVDQIDDSLRQYGELFETRLVPARQQTIVLIQDELDLLGQRAAEALTSALNTSRQIESANSLVSPLLSMLSDTLQIQAMANRYFDNNRPETRDALLEEIDKLSAAIGKLDLDAVSPGIRFPLRLAVSNVEDYQDAVNRVLEQQTLVVNTKAELDALGPKIAEMALALEKNVFNELGRVADAADQETQRALTFTATAFFVSMVLGLIAAIWISRLVASGVKTAQREILAYLDAIERNEGQLSTRLSPGRADEVGDFINAVNAFLATLEETISRIISSSRSLSQESDSLSAITQRTSANSEQQRDQITQVSAAMQEMVSTSEEIASNTNLTDESARRAETLAQSGQQTVTGAVQSTNALAEQITAASTRIRELEAQSENIGAVLDVIQGIAEQTNLLALNAAIEAARAGEAGRGFAVVADEVRGLAKRVQESTVNIERIVSGLQSNAAGAVVDMDKAKQMAGEASEQAGQSGKALSDILAAINQIVEMTTQIASATEQQRATAAEMTQSMEISSQAIDELAGDVALINQSSQTLATTGDGLDKLAQKFRASQ
ncbi:MAG: methyl-accepting chemotaxis protein [Pseudomonadota bacterium]|nr:methyl-accepting chemotaxis protein [Pseudomonadota bacterium]